MSKTFNLSGELKELAKWAKNAGFVEGLIEARLVIYLAKTKEEAWETVNNLIGNPLLFQKKQNKIKKGDER